MKICNNQRNQFCSIEVERDCNDGQQKGEEFNVGMDQRDRSVSLSNFQIRERCLFLVTHEVELDWTEISSIIDPNGIHRIYQ